MNTIFITLGLLLSSTLTQAGELDFEFDCKGYQTYVFDNNGKNLQLARNIGLKTKTDAFYTLQENEIGKRPRCNNIKIGEHKIEFTEEIVFPYVDPRGYKLNIVVPVTGSGSSTTEDLTLTELMNLMNNPGYLGSLWLGRDIKDKEIVLNRPLESIPDAYNQLKYTCPTGEVLDTETHRFNCIFDGDAIDDYFLNDISYNWALWLLIFYLLSFFFLNTCLDDGIPIEYAKDSDWTIHPAVSIWTRGSEIFTKQSRFANYFFFLGSLSFFTSLMHIKWAYKHLAIRLLVFPVFGTIFALLTTIVSGAILNALYKVQWEFIDGYKKAESHDDKKHNLDKYDKRSFELTYIFYIYLIFAMAHFTIWPIYIMHDLPLEIQGYWIIGIIIGMAFDLLMWRILMVLLAHVALFKRVFKVYGYYYDNKLHEEYSAIVGYKL